MADQQAATKASHGSTPSPAELLRAALEKIVFFEWRLSEIAAELASAQSRTAAAELERSRAEELARAAQYQTQAARRQASDLEAERTRLAALLAHPPHAAELAPRDGAALEAERERSALLEAELAGARRELDRQRAERERWLVEMIDQARSGDEAPAALAQFISELRAEVIALRARAAEADALLTKAGIAPPPSSEPPPPALAPQRDPEPVEAARKFWAEGRLGGASAAFDSATALTATQVPGVEGAAARALVDQCLRSLQSHDPPRREQAARHLAALPVSSAAPLVAAALGEEREPRTRSWLVRALVACGGEGAAGLAAQLQSAVEPALVRLAALEALCQLGGDRARAALEAAANDSSTSVRRRAAALSAASGQIELLARLSLDDDASVRAACQAATREAEAPEAVQMPAAPPPRNLAREAIEAVQATIFGLTEAELAEVLGLETRDADALAARLLEGGKLARRGKRLVVKSVAVEGAR